MRPGCRPSRTRNDSATASGAWFGSMMPPLPTRIVEVAAATGRDHHHRRAAGDAADVVVLGEPEALVAERLGGLGQRDGVVQRRGGGPAGRDRGQVEHGQRHGGRCGHVGPTPHGRGIPRIPGQPKVTRTILSVSPPLLVSIHSDPSGAPLDRRGSGRTGRAGSACFVRARRPGQPHRPQALAAQRADPGTAVRTAIPLGEQPRGATGRAGRGSRRGRPCPRPAASRSCGPWRIRFSSSQVFSPSSLAHSVPSAPT